MRQALLLALFVLAAFAGIVSAMLIPDWRASPIRAGSTEIAVGDTWFCDASFQSGVCETTVSTGDTVVWDFSGALLAHTSTECGASCDMPSAMPLWDSGVRSGGPPFERQFNQAGTFLYRCQVHTAEMRGRIVVQSAGIPPTPAVTPPRRAGDADCSGSVNAIDAAIILQRNAGLIPAVSCQDNADVDGNGRIDSIDAALVLQFVAGLLPSLPP